VLPVGTGSVTASSVSIPAASVQTTAGVVSSTVRSSTLLVTDALATTTGLTAVPRAVSQQATTGVGASLSWACALTEVGGTDHVPLR
jgi:hypothetical protein